VSATDRARDFVARFLTDTTQFDTAPVNRDLEATGNVVTNTTRKIETEGGKITSAARRAGTNAGQALASGFSDLASGGGIAGALQSVAGTLGNLGLAGLGISLGAGIVSNIVKGMAQHEEEVKAQAKSLFESIQKEGAGAAKDALAASNLQTLVQDPDKVASLALLGITPAEWASASAGVASDVESVRDKIATARSEAAYGMLRGTPGFQAQQKAVRDATDELDDYADAMGRAETALGRLATKARDSYTDQIYNPNSRRIG
jgi:hypothetical protein